MARVEALTGAIRVQELGMSEIPIHLQRRFEQRWASRFTLAVAANMPKNVETKVTPSASKDRRRAAKNQRKSRRREPEGSKGEAEMTLAVLPTIQGRRRPVSPF